MAMLQTFIDRLRGRHAAADEPVSLKLRAKYAAAGVEIGLYSYGCFDLARVPAGVTIGRYCSFAPTAQILLRNHGVHFIGLTAYLFNEKLGVVDRNMLPHARLTIQDDVWIGHNAIILPQVGEIGRGAVIGAGAVVTRPVPAYAIVAGNPAQVLRLRFDQTIIDRIEATRWWELDLAALRRLAADNPDLIFRPSSHFANA